MSRQKETPQERYLAAHRKGVTIAFILPNENDVYDYLKKKSNMAGYIKSLIKQDMGKGS